MIIQNIPPLLKAYTYIAYEYDIHTGQETRYAHPERLDLGLAVSYQLGKSNPIVWSHTAPKRTASGFVFLHPLEFSEFQKELDKATDVQSRLLGIDLDSLEKTFDTGVKSKLNLGKMGFHCIQLPPNRSLPYRVAATPIEDTPPCCIRDFHLQGNSRYQVFDAVRKYGMAQGARVAAQAQEMIKRFPKDHLLVANRKSPNGMHTPSLHPSATEMAHLFHCPYDWEFAAFPVMPMTFV
jgi:hypothetical protein